MRIAIDYTAAARQKAGIGRYARELISAILTTPAEHRVALMTAMARLGNSWRTEKTRLQTLAPNHLSFRDLPITDDWMARLWQRLRLPLPAEVVTGKVDVFYSPDFVLPPLRQRTHALLTVHDLSYLRHPETFPPALRAYLDKAVARSIARADHILTDSNATRQDLIALLNVAPEKASTLYCGISAQFSPSAAPDERTYLQHKYDIGERPYILAVGTIQPRKNYRHLMWACDPLIKTHRVDLVLAGRPAWLAEETLQAAATRDYVHLMGYFDDADLPALYRQAAILAFPSLYEGFGMPPLEAMACGTPVAASTASSIPEVVGDAGLLADPHAVAPWTDILERLLDDDPLRQQLRHAGFAQAARFTWQTAAQQWWTVVNAIQTG